VQHDRELGVWFGLEPAFGGDPGCAGDRGGEHLGTQLALTGSAGAGRDRFREGVLDRGDGVEELRLQGGCGGDQCERVAVGFAVIGVLLDERADDGVLEWLVGGALAQRGCDVLAAFRGERDDDRLLAAGEVVVVGARGDPGGLGDVVDPNVLRSMCESQPQRGGTQGLPGGELLARRPLSSVLTPRSLPKSCVRA
jgi:hypothetical protein